MAQTKVLRVIHNTSNRITSLQFFLILVLLFSISIISFSQVFSAYLRGVCVTLFNPPHSCCCQQIRKNIFFRTILYYLELFCPREMVQVKNSRTVRFKGPNSLVHWLSPRRVTIHKDGQFSQLLKLIPCNFVNSNFRNQA